MTNPETVYRMKLDARHGNLQWCGHCKCFHHHGICPCEERRRELQTKNRDLEAKVAELRGLLADYITNDEQA